VAGQQLPELALSCQVLQQVPFLGCLHPAPAHGSCELYSHDLVACRGV
jgi:hypothetical protein